MKIGVGLGLSRPYKLIGGVWVPADTTGLVAVLDPSQSPNGQSLIETVGGNNLQLGSTSGADTNDPSWVDSALAYVTDDYCEDGTQDAYELSGEFSLIYVLAPNDTGSTYPYVLSHCKTGNPTTGDMSWASYLVRTTSLIQGFAVRWYDGSALKTVEKSDVNFAYDTYQSFAMAVKANEQKLYFNGSSTAVQSGANTTGVSSNADAELVVGATAWYATPRTNYFEGEMGIVCIYDTYKTGAELTAIHNDIRSNFPDYSLPEGS